MQNYDVDNDNQKSQSIWSSWLPAARIPHLPRQPVLIELVTHLVASWRERGNNRSDPSGGFVSYVHYNGRYCGRYELLDLGKVSFRNKCDKMDDKPDQAADPATATEEANKVSPITRSFAHRLFHPPKLERKHSSGDLHSRLKTRKILGVGETDNGDVHRSKISQLLGHNEHLYVKFPKGYWIWHLTIAIVFTVVGIMTFLFPDQCYNVVTEEPISEIHLKAMTRYFGSGVIAMALLMWAFLGTIDKFVARSLLAAITLVHSLFLFATLIHFWQRLDGICHFCLVTAFCLAAIVSSAYFYWAFTTCNPRMRKSASHKELRDSLAKFASTDNSTHKTE